MVCQIYDTARLRLKLSHTDLAAPVNDYFLRSKNFLRGTEPLRDDNFYTLEYQKAELQKDMDNARNMSSIKFWVTRCDDEKIIGMASLSGIITGAFQSCFLSYRLEAEYINRGYMTEAVSKCVEIAFTELGLHRIEANIMPGNTASLRVVEKLNFINEGLAKNYLKINGAWEDHIHMVLLNDRV